MVANDESEFRSQSLPHLNTEITQQQNTNSSGRHYMSQWVKTTDLCFKTDSKSVIFSGGSHYVRGSYYVYHWILRLTEEKRSYS